MNWFSTFRWMWCLALVVSFSVHVSPACSGQADPAPRLRDIVAVLRVLWGRNFDSNYRKYMRGESPTIILIPRAEMMQIAAARPDGRNRDGATTQGLTITGVSSPKILVVYDDIAPLLVAKSINHEIGHLNLTTEGLPRNREEARIRKTVDTAFFETLFGREWVELTVQSLKKKVSTVEKSGRVFRGYTPEAIETFYERLRHAGTPIEKNPLHDRILGHIVFIFTNSEEAIAAALDLEDNFN